jgi:hypothetical protein
MLPTAPLLDHKGLQVPVFFFEGQYHHCVQTKKSDPLCYVCRESRVHSTELKKNLAQTFTIFTPLSDDVENHTIIMIATTNK